MYSVLVWKTVGSRWMKQGFLSKKFCDDYITNSVQNPSSKLKSALIDHLLWLWLWLWLIPWEGKMGTFHPVQDFPHWSCKKLLSFWPYHKLDIDLACLVKMAIHSLANIEPFWPHTWSIMHVFYHLKVPLVKDCLTSPAGFFVIWETCTGCRNLSPGGLLFALEMIGTSSWTIGCYKTRCFRLNN